MKKAGLILLLTLNFAMPTRTLAQGCSVCTKTASELDGKSARGLNGGILYLAFLPLGILGTLGFVWWKSRAGQQ